MLLALSYDEFIVVLWPNMKCTSNFRQEIKLKYWPCCSCTIPSFLGEMRQTDSKVELVFEWSYLVSGDVCWIICDKRIIGLLAASPAVDTHLFFPLMSNYKLSRGRINRQALPLPHSPTFCSHIKCPEEHTSHGFIPLCVQPKSQSNWSQLSTWSRNISSFMES